MDWFQQPSQCKQLVIVKRKKANPMKFSISSDLHLDTYPLSVGRTIIDQINNSGADVHLIAGDCYNDINHTDNFFMQLDDYTCLVYGNHEFHNRMQPIDDYFYVRDFDGIKVFCGTLWTDFNNGDPLTEMAVFNGLNDSFWIKDYSIENIKKINKLHREAIFDIQPDVVVTHHAPSRQSVAERYKMDYHMNGGFVNNYDNLIVDSKIKVWCHGHTHTRMDYMIGNTRVICNPLGYRGENAAPWKPVVFEL